MAPAGTRVVTTGAEVAPAKAAVLTPETELSPAGTTVVTPGAKVAPALAAVVTPGAKVIPAVDAPESLMVVPEVVGFAAGLAPKSAIKIKIVINQQPDRPSNRNIKQQQQQQQQQQLYFIRSVARIFRRGWGGGIPKEKRDQIINVGMIDHASSEDLRVLGRSVGMLPEKN